MRCRICYSTEFTPVLDLGATPFADNFLTAEQLEHPETYYPLKVVVCDRCNLMQLTYVASRTLLYQGDYPYVSSTTDMGVRHYHDMAETIISRFNVEPGSLAIDIGSNVGVLLEGFKNSGLSVLGIEPAPQIAQMANVRGIESINEFFSAELAAKIVKHRQQATVITGTNVVAHIDDLHDLATGIKTLLVRKGVFVFEAPYLGDLIKKLEYDTIYHEHLSYLSIRPISVLLDQFDMEVFDVEKMRIHGGTLRYYIAAKGDYPVNELVKRMAAEEDKMYDRANLRPFAQAVQQHRLELNGLLRDLKRQGKRIVAVSAPAKGMTLLHYCKIGRELLDFVTEKAPLKIGKYTPGTHLPVVPDAELLEQQPDYALLLAWNFAEEIMRNLQDYSQAGGRFIIPIPKPLIVSQTA